MTAPRRCIECGTLTARTRCTSCAKTTARGYGSGWQALRRALIVGRVCVQCGHRGSVGNPLTLDHVVPKVHGGTDHVSNLQVLCRSHNSAKGAR